MEVQEDGDGSSYCENSRGIYQTRQEFGGQEFRRHCRQSESLNCQGHALDAMGPHIDSRSGECGRRGNGECSNRLVCCGKEEERGHGAESTRG